MCSPPPKAESKNTVAEHLLKVSAETEVHSILCVCLLNIHDLLSPFLQMLRLLSFPILIASDDPSGYSVCKPSLFSQIFRFRKQVQAPLHLFPEAFQSQLEGAENNIALPLSACTSEHSVQWTE